jgi:3-oxoacyl-[acyl-carrier protein] reductase
MDLALEGRCALVGGASKGIGYAIASLLAAERADVAIVARHANELAEAAARIRAETGRRVIEIPADIRKAADCQRILDTVASEFGKLDILVNNDGAPPLGLMQDFDDEAWHKAVEQNLMSVVRLSRGALPLMRAGGWGRIVNITSLSTLQPLPRLGLSVATWAAVHAFAKTLSLEIATEGITVNTVCPGRFATERLAKVFSGADGKTPEEFMAELAKDVPMNRIGDPKEIAGLVAFLASSWSGYITGCTLHVDGGRRAGVA